MLGFFRNLSSGSKEDESAFHNQVAGIYEDPNSPMWNPSKALHHWEQATKGDHSLLQITSINDLCFEIIKRISSMC